MFPGDMERQDFVGGVIYVQRNEASFEDEESDDEGDAVVEEEEDNGNDESGGDY